MSKCRDISISVIAAAFALTALAGGCSRGTSSEESKPAAKGQSAAKGDQPAQTRQAAEQQGKPKAEQGEEERLVLSPEEVKRAGIATVSLEAEEIHETVEVTATIEPNADRLAKIAPRVSGRLVQVMAHLGDRVRAKQVMALLDSVEVGEASSAYLQAKSSAGLADANLERAERLNAEQIIAQKDYLAARSDKERADAALRAAEDRLRLLGLSPDKMQGGHAVAVYALTAPFSGTVIEKNAVLGELATSEKSLFTVADLSTVWIEANLFEKDLARVRRGAKASVTVAAYPEGVFDGRLTYISSVVDKDTRTIKARIEVHNGKGRLMPEMFATARIETEQGREALIAPSSAVLLVDGQPSVFIKEGTGFELRTVELGERLSGRVVLDGGVEEGEQLVTSGAYALKARMLKSKIGDTD